MKLLRALLWVLTAALAGLESVLTVSWLKWTLYLMEYGREENPYVAEDADIAGFCALRLLPLTLAALYWAVRQLISKTER